MGGFVYVMILLVMIIFHIMNVDVNIRRIRFCIVIGTMIFCTIYDIIFFGFHTGYTYVHRMDKISIRGIDKKEYRKRLNKLKKHEDASSKQENDSAENKKDR